MKKPLTLLALCLLTQAFSPSALAQNRSQAEARYTEDKKICYEESSSAARMQCLRDARAEYDRAQTSVQSGTAQSYQRSQSCPECGQVTAVRVEDVPREGGLVGTIAGGVAGAMLGSKVGGGVGQDLATIAGAVGGAYAGRTIEGKINPDKVWKVSVRFENGGERVYVFDNDPGLAVGTLVKASGSSIQRR